MLRGLVTAVVSILSTVVLGLLAIVGGIVFPRANVGSRLGKLWSRVHLSAMGVRPSYTGLEHAAGVAPRIFLANHFSNVDIWATAPVLPDTYRFVAKRSLFWVPVLGQAIWVAGFVPIDRGNRSSAIASLGRAAARIRGGASVILFPEGTRSRDGRLGPFKRGPFHLAVEAGVPVVPVAISGSGKVAPPRTLAVAPGPIRVTFCEPIPAAELPALGIDGLMARVRSAIVERLAPDELHEADREAARGAAPS